MQFYTYVWYDPDWIPYYVGKGVGCRSRQRRDIPHPEEGHVVLKYFDLEEEAFEHEKALIAFWGRRDFDTNGLLMNKALGGPGTPGVPKTPEELANLKLGPAVQAEKASKEYFVTSPKGKTFKIKNLTKFCRENNICRGNLFSTITGKRNHSNGWKCRHA